MKKYGVCVLLGAVLLLWAGRPEVETEFVKESMQSADSQIKLLLDDVRDSGNAFPRSTDANGKMVTTSMYDWTPGFFPGELWYAYESTKDPAMKNAAIQWTEKLEPLKDFKDHHDLGFMMYCSYGNAYRLTGNPAYKDILVQAAKSLCTRFSVKTGCIKSWNVFHSWHGNKSYRYPVIIDNMMNLELLFFATQVTGDSSYYKVAVTHANTTLKNHFRKDFSSYHVVCYDSATGRVEGQETAQGYADNSTWSRGQAWAIYGFTMTYRETADVKYLKAAMGMADWYIQCKTLPDDKIPYWDFNVDQQGFKPGTKSNALAVKEQYRDASAGAITASALLELSTYTGKKGKKYKAAAIQMLHSLASPEYRSVAGTNGNFLLKHSVGSIPHKAEVDAPLIYADYYYVEALIRYQRLLKGQPIFDEATGTNSAVQTVSKQ